MQQRRKQHKKEEKCMKESLNVAEKKENVQKKWTTEEEGSGFQGLTDTTSVLTICDSGSSHRVKLSAINLR